MTVCGCDTEPGYICSQCAGTPFDPYYFLDGEQDERMTPDEFDKLLGREVDGAWLRWA